MPNSIGPSGLTVATQAEVLGNLTTSYQNIYGADIVVSSDSPDGQTLNLFTQAVIDLEDLLVQIYNMFDPDNAIGVILDQRVAINGIQRQAGTYTVQNITIVASQACTLFGLDQVDNLIYTVADAAGNQYEIITTQNIAAPGTYSFPFQAVNPGAVSSNLNSITVQVSIILGITSVNNPTTYTTLGVTEESDAQLKVRRQQSTQGASQGFFNGMYTAVANVPGVTAAYIYLNNTNITDSNGVPSHSIWVIVDGTATSAAIAQAIYNKLNEGCGLVGQQTYVITQADGSYFTIRWDNVEEEDVYVKFTATSLNGTTPPNLAAILTQLPTVFVPGVSAEININQLATAVQSIDPNTLVTAAGISLTQYSGYSNTLSPSTKNFQFVLTTQGVYVLPMVMLPVTVTVPRTLTQQFTPYGGSQTGYTYALTTNNSGGSVSGTGLYTAGSSIGQDILQVTDSLSNTITSTITVT